MLHWSKCEMESWNFGTIDCCRIAVEMEMAAVELAHWWTRQECSYGVEGWRKGCKYHEMHPTPHASPPLSLAFYWWASWVPVFQFFHPSPVSNEWEERIILGALLFTWNSLSTEKRGYADSRWREGNGRGHRTVSLQPPLTGRTMQGNAHLSSCARNLVTLLWGNQSFIIY